MNFLRLTLSLWERGSANLALLPFLPFVFVCDSASFQFPCALSERRMRLIRHRNGVVLIVNASTSPTTKWTAGSKTCWNPFKAPWGFLFESAGAQASLWVVEIAPATVSLPLVGWWCMGNHFKAMQTGNLALTDAGGLQMDGNWRESVEFGGSSSDTTTGEAFV